MYKQQSNQQQKKYSWEIHVFSERKVQFEWILIGHKKTKNYGQQYLT